MSRTLLLAALFLLTWPALPLRADGLARPSAPLMVDEAVLGRTSHGALSEPIADGIEFTLLEDGVDAEGRWFQIFRMLIKPGGTLADTSELIYGNSEHIGELFAAIKQQHPNLRGPSQVPANTQADITVDPRAAFVPQGVSTDAGRGPTTYTYYTAARGVVYDPKRAKDYGGLSAVVDLPADRPTQTFTILEDFVPVAVPAGVPLAYYEYQAGDDLKKVVAEIYGRDSSRAMHHFLTQTQWDPNRWPPPPTERQQRLAFSATDRFEDEPFTPLDVAAGNPANGEQLKEQVAKRGQAGIYALR